MNLTLLPTDLKFTDKSSGKNQSTLNGSVNGNPSSQFGQLLNAETASMRKPTTQADKHSQNNLKEGKSVADKTAQGERSPLQMASDKTVSRDALQTDTSLQESRAEFAVLKEEDLLSAEALSAVIPIQIADLVNPPAHSAVFQENAEGLMENALPENSLPENALSENKWSGDENNAVQALLGKNAKDIRLAATDLTESSQKGAPDKDIPLSAVQDMALNNKTETRHKTENPAYVPGLASLAGQVKLAANNKAEYGSVFPKDLALNNNKALNLLQAAPELTTVTAETAFIDSPTVPAASPLLSGGQPATGQFQLTGTTAPLLNAHLGSEEWQQQLNQHVLFFNRNGLQQAELRLHPQELGALHIRMSVEDNQAQLHFVSAHQNVRAALEAALPGLRHSLAESGIQLAQSSVGSDAQGNWQQEHHASNQANNQNRSQNNGHSNSHADSQSHGLVAATGITASHTTISLTPQQLASTRGGVDTFA
ncbi:flagellar hook-length control protein FliK [Xenorhabdus beddingii]|uniref:Flagellar hook-length control protein FliK n=1 Tax=Xenorhabdus beddingii TaxID=40578 RepID=A0A1Y2SRX6_9GAMM|nr:flagellar hook-length control protein FliK [Xenorhabdus beddingii]OTA21081.1 flagellar hook-length control protein FliK [Xenorhabdus beddingii]